MPARILLGMLLACASSSVLSAGTILYDTFGPGLTTDSTLFAGGGSTIIVGTPFVPSMTAQLGTVVAALGSNGGTAYAFSIWTDLAGDPGAMLEQWPVSPSSSIANIQFSSVLEPTLYSGTQYWALYTATASANAGLDWGYYNLSPSGGFWLGSSPTGLVQVAANFAKPALHIEGTTVPEPSTSVLFASVVAFLAVARHRRKPAGISDRLH